MRNREKAKKIRIIISILLILSDIFIIPYLLAIAEISVFSKNILNFDYIHIIKYCFNSEFLKFLYAAFQILVLYVLISLLWDTSLKHNTNKNGLVIAGNGEFGTARWQSEEEKAISCYKWDTNKNLEIGGIFLGVDFKKSFLSPKKEYMYLEQEDTHTLLIATTRGGKSRRNILPTIWSLAKSGESMVIGDVKGELFLIASEYLKKKGYDVIAFDLKEPFKGSRWNIIEEVCKLLDESKDKKLSITERSLKKAKAIEAAWDIANTIVPKKEKSNSDPVWENGEQAIIAATIILVANEADFKFQRHIFSVYNIIAQMGEPISDRDGKERVPLIEYISKLDRQHPARLAFAVANISPKKMQATFFTTALTDLRLFSSVMMADMTASSDYDMGQVGIKKTAIFFIIPDDRNTNNIIASLYIDQLYSKLSDIADNYGGRLPIRVNLLLDEFGNLPAINNFDTKITVGGGKGMRFVLSIQDFQQLKKAYGDNSATIIGNCHNLIYLISANDEVNKIISARLGKFTMEIESLNASVQTSSDKGGSSGNSISLTGRELMTPDELSRLPMDECVVIRLRNYPAKNQLADLSKLKANKDFGLTGNKKKDTEIMKERRESRKMRENVDYPKTWLPLFMDIEEEETKEDEVDFL